MTRSFTLSMTAGLALCCSLAGRANEIFPVIHNEPITVQVLSGIDGKPVPHAHLLVVAGYDQEDLRLRLWQDETLTDAEGKVLLSRPLGNLPFLQVWVGKARLCQDSPRKSAFSIEQIRRDGLSTPNRCGVASVADRAGMFTVFVRPGKKLLSPERKDVLAFKASLPATTPAPQTAPARNDAPIANPQASSTKPALPPIVGAPASKDEQKPDQSAKEAAPVAKPAEAAVQHPASLSTKEEGAKPSPAELNTAAKSPLAPKPATAGMGKAPAHALPAKRKTTTKTAAAEAKGTAHSKLAASRAKAKPAAATTVESKPSGAPAIAPKIAVNLETAPQAVHPASLESPPKAKPAAGRDLEQPLARSPVRSTIKNPKDAAAAVAAAAKAKAARHATAPATATAGTPGAAATPASTLVTPAAAGSPAKDETKKD